MKNYAIFEAELEKEYRPYRDVLRGVMREFSRMLNVEITEEEELTLVNTLPDWSPFEDPVESLKRIKKFAKIAIISNVDNDLIQKTVENLGVDFDFIVTAEMVGAYKPSLKVFEYAHGIFNVPKHLWTHVAQSTYHDIVPAKKFGIKAILIKRRGHGATPPVSEKPELEFQNLAELARWVEEFK